MARRDLRSALREADTLLEEHPAKAAVDRRLRARLEDRLARPALAWPRSALAWGMVGAAAAAVVLAAVLWPEAEHRLPPRPDTGGLTLASATADLRLREGPGRAVEVTSGRCLLVDQPRGMGVRLEAGAAVRREERGVRVLRGKARFAVLRRPADGPVARVLVSHGAIEVVGTVFTVTQGRTSGRVTLYQGAIRFAWADGSTEMLAPGDSLAWPRSKRARTVVPRPSQAPRHTRRRRSRHTWRARRPKPVRPSIPAPVRHDPPAVKPILRRVAVLRSRGDFRGAAAELARALRLPLRRVTRERLGFELGSILTYQVRSRERACAHWRAHRRRYPGGRYEPEIQEAWTTLGCAQGR